MKTWQIRKTVLLSCLFFGSCGHESFERDAEPPSVAAIIPDSVLKSERDFIEISFSEPIISLKRIDSCFRFAKTGTVSLSQIQRLAKFKQVEASSPFVSIAPTLKDTNNKIEIVPQERLEFGESYTLWIFDCLRDHAGRPLTLTDEAGFSEYHFKIEQGPFELSSNDVLIANETKVAPNRKYFHFQFSYPIAQLPVGAVRLGDQKVECSLSADRRSLTVSLPDNMAGCERMPTDAALQFTFSGVIKDDLDRSLAESKIAFQSEVACKVRAASLFGPIRQLGYDTHFEITFDVQNLLSARMSYGSSLDGLGCQGKVCPQLMWPFAQPGRASINIDELTPDSVYQYELEVEDLFGERETRRGQFDTKRMAKIAINEIFANPKTEKGRTDSASEFIELYNYGDEAADISEFSIDLGTKSCSLFKNKGTLVVPPKSYVLLVGKKFDTSIFGLSESPMIHRMPGQAICGNLRNSLMLTVALKDEFGRNVDQFLGMPEAQEKGYSIERLNPEAKNGKEQFCYSRSDVGPTPLRENGVAKNGCEDQERK